MNRSSALLWFILGVLLIASAGPAWGQVSPGSYAQPQSATSSPGSPAAGAPQATQSVYSGSVPSSPVSGVLKLSLSEAVQRGLKQNLGALLSSQDITAAQGERWKQLSALLPNVSLTSYTQVSQINLKEFGFGFKIPNVNLPFIVGPFGYYDARAYLTQTLLDWNALNKKRSANESLKSAQYSYKDARDLVVLAVGYAYLLGIADEARIETAVAQVKTAQVVYDQASDQVNAGTSPAIDALRAQVELKTRQQQLIQARNDFDIQKLTIARVIGLAPGQEFELIDKSPYDLIPMPTVEEALKRAYESRSDFQAALADVRAAEFTRKAATAEYYPALSSNGDYGVAGTTDNLATHGVFDVRGTLTIPIFAGGKTHGDVLEAKARLAQNRDKLENLRGQIDADVRTALFNLQSSAEQVAVAKDNIDLAETTLSQSQDRFKAGVTDTVEVVQAQEQVASANENYISSLYSYNYAKISLARALGAAEQGVKDYFKGQ